MRWTDISLPQILYRAMTTEEAVKTLEQQKPAFLKRFKFFSDDINFIRSRVRDGKFAHSQYKNNPYEVILKFEVLDGIDNFKKLNSKELMLDVRKIPLITFGKITKMETEIDNGPCPGEEKDALG